MACEACNAKFSLFKRKKQCMDCLRHFCSECVIKRLDKVLSCDSCSVLSRRPLVRSQIAQMRARDLRRYLVVKRVRLKGCVEKDDLISLLMLFANGTDDRPSSGITGNASSRNIGESPTISSPPTRSRSPPSTPAVVTEEAESSGCRVELRTESTERTAQSAPTNAPEASNVQIEEVSGSGGSSPNDGPEPLITEQDDISDASDARRSETITEIPVWSDDVKLTDISEVSDLEYLTIKQLKNLLSTNRVNYKGCIERCELLNRATRLWEEHKQSRAVAIEGLDQEDLCKICWDAPIECVILECGHMACCITCGKQMSECPICKQYVVRVVRFFKA